MAKFVRLDNMAATKTPSLLKSAKYFVADVATAIENGELVTIGEFVDGEREIHEATAPVSGDTYIGLVCTPEVEYDEKGYHDLDTFANGADEVIRVAMLQKGDIFSIANEGAGADKTVDGEVVAKFMGAEVSGRFTYNVYEVM
jgi:hypothetical protein